MSITGRNVVTAHAFPDSFTTRIQEYRALLTTVRWWWSQTTCLWSKTPFLHVGFNENKSHLSEVYVDLAGPLSTNSREEVLRLETVCDIVQLLAVASEKDRAGARPVANSNDISLNICRSIS
jgi:hypothetical protein